MLSDCFVFHPTERSAITVRIKKFLLLQWSDPQELHGIGRYGADAYYIFCRNQWQEREPPLDKDLLKYYTWLKETNGEGKGFAREQFVAAPTSSPSASSVSVGEAVHRAGILAEGTSTRRGQGDSQHCGQTDNTYINID